MERRLPGTLIVNLQERRPFAIWQNQGKFVLVDRAGQVVANQDVTQFRHLPLIVGLGAPAAAADLLDALRDRPALAEKVSASVRVGERRWNLRMTNGSDVMLPEGHEVAALDRLMQLQQEQAVLDRPLAAIDMRLPDRLVFRPKPEAKDSVVPPPPSPRIKPAHGPRGRQETHLGARIGWQTILAACFPPPIPDRRKSNRRGIIVPVRSALSISARPRSPA